MDTGVARAAYGRGVVGGARHPIDRREDESGSDGGTPRWNDSSRPLFRKRVRSRRCVVPQRGMLAQQPSLCAPRCRSRAVLRRAAAPPLHRRAAPTRAGMTSVTQLDAACPAEPLPGVSREVRASQRALQAASAQRERAQTAAQLAEHALVWSAQNGLVVAAAQAGTFTHAPLSLLPTPLPRDAFERARALAAPFGRLTAAVAADADFLRTTLAGACASDDFTARLFALFDLTRAQKARALALSRRLSPALTRHARRPHTAWRWAYCAATTCWTLPQARCCRWR